MRGVRRRTHAASPAPAHPHVFVDAGIEITLDPDGRLEAITVTWIYDEYYSLLITEELGLDPDYDGVLTAEETATLTGFDMNWAPGFNGDLEATLDGAPLALSGPEAATAALRPDGRILTTHRRAVPARPAMAGRVLSLKPYDESYYTAYEVPQPPVLSPTLCLRGVRRACSVQGVSY